MNTNDTPIAHRVVARFKAAAPRGKAQTAIMDYLNSHDGGEVSLTEISKAPALRGSHFGDIQSAAEALKKQGLIEYNGKTLKKK